MRRVVETLRYPYILINHSTQKNTPPKCARVLFVDCGGFSGSLLHNRYTTSDEEYLTFVRKHHADFFALRDYPCEPQILRKHNLTVREQIDRTVDHHLRLLDLYEDYTMSAVPVPVLQGWKVRDYLCCLDEFNDYGFLSRGYLAIGTLCRRHQVGRIRNIILSIRREIPPYIKLHAFGVKMSVLRSELVTDALYSADSSAMEYAARYECLTKRRSSSRFEQTLDITRAYIRRIERMLSRADEACHRQQSLTMLTHV